MRGIFTDYYTLLQVVFEGLHRILKAVEDVNRSQREWFLQKIMAHYGGDLAGRVFACTIP